MVVKPFSHLARHSFGKTFTHGYAQSVVAATQSSYASTTTPFVPFNPYTSNRYARPGTAQGHALSSLATKPGQGTSQTTDTQDGGLNAYQEAWQKHHLFHGSDSKEWRKVPLPKRIGWRQEEKTVTPVESPHHTELERSYSTNAVDDLKKVEDVAADDAVAKEIDPRQELEEVESSSPRSAIETAPTSLAGDSGVLTPKSDSELGSYSQHIDLLYRDGAFAQIPSVFAAMLARGITPDVKAYNNLLESAIYASAGRHQAVPRALSIYADMLGRKVRPDTRFFTNMLSLLSGRALDVFHQKGALEQKRQRFEAFLFASQQTEYAILSEDDAFKTALEVFRASIADTSRSFPAEVYHRLVTACATHGALDSMTQAYRHMEESKVRPTANIFPPMIDAFARHGDLASAVECYNEYKTLAMEDNAGRSTLEDRQDNKIYAAVIKAYTSCGKTDGADRFTSKIVGSLDGSHKERYQELEDTIVLDAVLKEHLTAKRFSAGMQLVEERQLTSEARTEAMTQIAIAAADSSDLIALEAYRQLEPPPANATLALLALQTRLGNQEAASDLFRSLSASAWDISYLEPLTFHVLNLFNIGRIDEGLFEARAAFERIRAGQPNEKAVTDQIDEAMEMIVGWFGKSGNVIAPAAAISLLWSMMDNGGLIPSSAEVLLASLGPDDIVNLAWQDLRLALQAEAGLIGSEAKLDIAHPQRFEFLLDISMAKTIPFDAATLEMIDGAVSTLSTGSPDLTAKWQQYRRVILSPSADPPVAENHDPYSGTTDFRGSSIIVDELESRRNSAGLNEALRRFRNIRFAGCHPRYTAYAKLINAAAREGRAVLTNDILGMARTDVPFVPGHPTVQQGWVQILDAMVGACLTTGRRLQAEQYHQELLSIGAAPTANTFGLYITTLKESTKTFDEATEAVTVFKRALSENVAPSSFLYNALIGKLGKARRIDDCLRYFQEMRTAGIRPTSVTYGTIVNALCRVSDERFAEELFDEMESVPNYKPRPAPYNSLMQFFLTTKRDSKKVLAYYERMRSRNIEPTMHTYKLLIDTYATLDPVNLSAAEAVLDTIRSTGQTPEAVHYASLIHAKGCVLHDMAGAREVFERAINSGGVRPQACLYQALFESMVANHAVSQTETILDSMSANRVEMTPYIANTLIHGWATENKIQRSKAIFDSVSIDKREPSTFEAMTRAFLTVEDRESAMGVVQEMLSRGYPAAVSNKVLELVGHGRMASA